MPTVLNAKKSLKEKTEQAVQVIARAISDVALKNLQDFMLKSKPADQSKLPSEIAAAMLYKARVRVLKNHVHDTAIKAEVASALSLLRNAR